MYWRKCFSNFSFFILKHYDVILFFPYIFPLSLLSGIKWLVRWLLSCSPSIPSASSLDSWRMGLRSIVPHTIRYRPFLWQQSISWLLVFFVNVSTVCLVQMYFFFLWFTTDFQFSLLFVPNFFILLPTHIVRENKWWFENI